MVWRVRLEGGLLAAVGLGELVVRCIRVVTRSGVGCWASVSGGGHTSVVWRAPRGGALGVRVCGRAWELHWDPQASRPCGLPCVWVQVV